MAKMTRWMFPAVFAVASLVSCGSPPHFHKVECRHDFMDNLSGQDRLMLPVGAILIDCGSASDDARQASHYLSFSVPPDGFKKFMSDSGFPAESTGQLGLDRDTAEALQWKIAKVPYFTPGVVGFSGDRPNGGRMYEMTVDERNPAQYFVYYYSVVS